MRKSFVGAMVIALVTSPNLFVTQSHADQPNIAGWQRNSEFGITGTLSGRDRSGQAGIPRGSGQSSNRFQDRPGKNDPYEYFPGIGCPLPGEKNPGDACKPSASCKTPDGSDGIVYKPYRRLKSGGDWELAGRSYCAKPGSQSPEDAESQVVDPVVTAEDFQKMPIKPVTVTLQPRSNTLKNYNTNVYLTGEQQMLNTEIVGRPVRVRATPVAYTYDYGDGTVKGPIEDRGRALPPDAWDVQTSTSHRYAKTGRYPVKITTTFRGEFSVDGGEWRPINGTASIASPVQNLTVWKTKSGWVQDSCRKNPNAWGC